MAMISKLLGIVRRAANARGVSIVRQTPVADQAALVRLMIPVATEHPLIRIGGDGDGGYLVPDDLDGLVACFSPGVDVMASFEEGMVARGIRCFQVDASVATSPLQDHSLVVFERKFVGIASDETTVTLDEWVVDKMGSEPGDLILQMDIEGAEWLVLAGASEATLARFRIMVIEFHDVDRLVDPLGFGVIAAVFDKLAKQFDVVHAHPNNCRPNVLAGAPFPVPGVIEYTFLRKDRSSRRAPVEHLPHSLDRDCTDQLPPLPLPRALYGRSAAA